MCPIGYVCLSAEAHVLLLVLTITGFLLLLIGMEAENKTPPQDPKNPVDKMRREWKEKVRRR